MTLSLAQLAIEELILHEVPKAKKRDDEAEPVQVSDLPVELSHEHRAYLQERFRADLGKNAMEVVEVEGSGTSVPARVKDLLLRDEADFVGASQAMAHQLRSVQGGNSPSGLLIVARCSWSRVPAILIAKVELEQGVRAQQTTRHGQATYDMEVIRDLVFGETSEIFKAGLFSAGALNEETDLLRGYAIDRQKSGPAVTRFFLLDYLGCEFVASPAESTRRFYESARGYFNASVSDPTLKAKYMLDLVSEIDSNRSEIDPRIFASDHLSPGDVPGFMEALGEGRVPIVRFPKSAEYVATQHVRLQTHGNVVVVAERDHLDSGVVEILEDGIAIHDPVESIKTQGRRGAGAGDAVTAEEAS